MNAQAITMIHTMMWIRNRSSRFLSMCRHPLSEIVQNCLMQSCKIVGSEPTAQFATAPPGVASRLRSQSSKRLHSTRPARICQRLSEKEQENHFLSCTHFRLRKIQCRGAQCAPVRLPPCSEGTHRAPLHQHFCIWIFHSSKTAETVAPQRFQPFSNLR